MPGNTYTYVGLLCTMYIRISLKHTLVAVKVNHATLVSVKVNKIQQVSRL